MTYAAELRDVLFAAERIGPHAHRTPVLTCETLDQQAGRALFFKCENLQKVGAFKFRGACNAILNLADDAASRGVVTHSSGNHAQALALAASMRSIDAHIVMPSSAPAVKRAAVAGYGATIYTCEPTLADRERLTDDVIANTGATFIPPYDHPDIIAGQGTIALELMDDVADLDAIVVPVGGGGMISGVSIAGRGLDPGLKIIGAEPTGADDAARSMAAGHLIPQTAPDTIADGLLTSLGEQTWPIIRDHVERIATVTDDEIIAAMRLVWERMKIVIEPSAATSVAVAMSSELDGLNRVGVVLSGGNVDLDRLPWLPSA